MIKLVSMKALYTTQAKILLAVIVFFSLSFFSVASAEYQFREPDTPFPGGNPAAPLDTSDVPQVKSGYLNIGNEATKSVELRGDSIRLQEGNNDQFYITNFLDPEIFSKGLLQLNVKGLQLPNVTMDEVASPKSGTIIYDKNTNTLQLYNGTAWGPIVGGGGGGGNYWQVTGNILTPSNPDALVGIGTSTPQAKLHVRGNFIVSSTSTFNGPVCIGGVCRSNWPSGGTGGSGDAVWQESNGNITLQNNGSRVGVGVTNPSAKLEVQGDVVAISNATGIWKYEVTESVNNADPRYRDNANYPRCRTELTKSAVNCDIGSTADTEINCNMQSGVVLNGDPEQAPRYCKDMYLAQPGNFQAAVIFEKKAAASQGGWISGTTGYPGDRIGIGGDAVGSDLEINISAPVERNKISFWNRLIKSLANVVTRDIYSFGKIGISTEQPAAALHLRSSAVIEGWTPSDSPNLQFVTNGNGASNLGAAGIKGWTLVARGPESPVSDGIEKNNFIVSYKDGEKWHPRLVVDDTGRVNIGTPLADRKAQLNITGDGTALFAQTRSAENSSPLILDHPDLQWNFHVSNDNHAQLILLDKTDPAYKANPANPGEAAYRWYSLDFDNKTGNLGLGTSGVSGSKLTVNGTTTVIGSINADKLFLKGVEIKSGGGSGGEGYWKGIPNGIGYKDGYVGVATDKAKAQLQVGDNWTFTSGGHKIIGYNYYYDTGAEKDKRITNDEVSNLGFNGDGDIYFRFAGKNGADSVIESWKTGLYMRNSDKGVSVGVGTSDPQGLFEIVGSRDVSIKPSSNQGIVYIGKNGFVPVDIRGNLSVESFSGSDFMYERGGEVIDLATSIKWNATPNESSWKPEWRSNNKMSCDTSLTDESTCTQTLYSYSNGQPNTRFDLFIKVLSTPGTQCDGVPPDGDSNAACSYYTAARQYNKKQVTGGGVFARYAGFGTGALDTSSIDTNYRLTTQGGGIKAVSGASNAAAGYFVNSAGPSIVTMGGNVGIGVDNPRESLQIGNRFTFHSGGQKLIGYNYYYDSVSSEDRRMEEASSSNIGFTSNGDIYFRFAGKGAASSKITDWQNGIFMTNTVDKGVLTGVGTSNPSAKLEVGGIKFNQIGVRFNAENANRYLFFVPDLNTDSYHSLSESGDSGLFFSKDTGFVIAPWTGNSNNGIRISSEATEAALTVSGDSLVTGNAKVQGNLEVNGSISGVLSSDSFLVGYSVPPYTDTFATTMKDPGCLSVSISYDGSRVYVNDSRGAGCNGNSYRGDIYSTPSEFQVSADTMREKGIRIGRAKLCAIAVHYNEGSPMSQSNCTGWVKTNEGVKMWLSTGNKGENDMHVLGTVMWQYEKYR